MRKTILAAVTGAIFLIAGSCADVALAKKGGVGQGGGYSEDGVLYHSHSDRSYSGRDYQKGKAVGHAKPMKGKGKAKGHSKKTPLE